MNAVKILLEILEKKGYNLDVVRSLSDNDKTLAQLEKHREQVFLAIYGEEHKQHGMNTYKEYLFHLAQAEADMRAHMIPMTMHYLLMQIIIKNLTLDSA